MIFRYFSAVLLFLLCSTELKSYISEPGKGRSQQAASFLTVLSLWFLLTLLKWVFPLVPVFWLFWWEVAAMPPGAQCQQPWQPTLGLPPRTKLPSDFTKTERLGARSFRRTVIFRALFIAKPGTPLLKIITQMWHMFCCKFSVELFPVISKINETLHSTFFRI